MRKFLSDWWAYQWQPMDEGTPLNLNFPQNMR